MVRQSRLPVARVADSDFEIGQNERVVLVDLDRLRSSKTYGQLKQQAASWDEKACAAYLLSLFCRGPV